MTPEDLDVFADLPRCRSVAELEPLIQHEVARLTPEVLAHLDGLNLPGNREALRAAVTTQFEARIREHLIVIWQRILVDFLRDDETPH